MTQADKTPVRHWAEVIENIDSKIAAQDEIIRNTEVRKAPLVLPATMGDTKAAEALHALDTQHAAAQNNRANLQLARTQAEGELAKAQAEQARQEKAARVIEASRLADESIALARECDRLSEQFREKQARARAKVVQIQMLTGSEIWHGILTIDHAFEQDNFGDKLAGALARFQAV